MRASWLPGHRSGPRRAPAQGTMADLPLAGKVSVVTGSGRRTGRVIALRLAGDGASVVLASRTAREIEAVAGEIRAAGGEALPVPTDVTSEEDAARLAREAVDAYGRLDHLVNAAGVFLPGPFPDYPLANWRLTLDTYLTGPFLCSQAAVREMAPRGSGHIVNISSTLIDMHLPGFEAYNAAKSGLVGFSQTLAASLRPLGIKVSVITPGAINATGAEADPGTKLEMEDVADAVSYLLRQPDHVHVPHISLRTVE